jgi:hypothetical protein
MNAAIRVTLVLAAAVLLLTPIGVRAQARKSDHYSLVALFLSAIRIARRSATPSKHRVDLSPFKNRFRVPTANQSESE